MMTETTGRRSVDSRNSQVCVCPCNMARTTPHTCFHTQRSRTPWSQSFNKDGLSDTVHSASLTQPCICSRRQLASAAALQGSSGSFRDDERQGMQRSLSRHLERLRRAEQVLSAVMPRCCSCIMPMLYGLNAIQLATASSEYI